MMRSGTRVFGIALLLLPTYVAADTLIEEDLFSLTLPGEWIASRDKQSDTWEYRAVESDEVVTIIVFERETRNSWRSIQKENEDHLTRIRSRQVSESANIELTEPRVTEIQRTFIVSQYEGYEAESGRRTFVAVIADGDLISTLILESYEPDARAFVRRAHLEISNTFRPRGWVP